MRREKTTKKDRSKTMQMTFLKKKIDIPCALRNDMCFHILPLCFQILENLPHRITVFPQLLGQRRKALYLNDAAGILVKISVDAVPHGIPVHSIIFWETKGLFDAKMNFICVFAPTKIKNNRICGIISKCVLIHAVSPLYYF